VYSSLLRDSREKLAKPWRDYAKERRKQRENGREELRERVGGFRRTAKPPTRGADSKTTRRPEPTAFAL